MHMVEVSDPQRRVEDVMVTCPKTLPPECSVEQVRRLFGDDHVHMALIVDARGHLLTTLERSDIPADARGTAQAAAFGVVRHRTIDPKLPADVATAVLQAAGRRRLAVVDGHGKLLGLLCLKRTGLGFCGDAGVAARAAERGTCSTQAG
jgi:CBS-domain-containing membrane protein